MSEFSERLRLQLSRLTLRDGGTQFAIAGATAALVLIAAVIAWSFGGEGGAPVARLGLNPNDAPTAIRDFLGAPSYPQFRQSVLVTDGPDEFDVRTDAFNECKAIFERAGESFSGDEGANKEDQIPGYCDTSWYVRTALEAAGRSLGLEPWMNAVHRITPVPSASVYLMQTKADRHDGSGAIRIGKWFDDCTCFKATSP